MKTDNNLSVRKTLSVARTLRQFSVKFETGLRGKLSSYNRQLQDFFEIKNMGDIGGSKIVKDIPIVYCVDVNGLIQKIQETWRGNNDKII